MSHVNQYVALWTSSRRTDFMKRHTRSSFCAVVLALQVTPITVGTQQPPMVDRKVYSSAGHPNAKGMDFRIEFPATWLAKEGRNPNVVQNLVSDRGRGLEMCVLLVRALPATASATEINDAFSPEGLRAMEPAGGRFISGIRTKLNGLPAAAVRISAEVENAGTKLRQELIQYVVIWTE